MEQEVLLPILEAMLFASDKPVPLPRLMEVLGDTVTESQVEEALQMLSLRYSESMHGMEVRKAQGGYHFVTKAQHSDWLRKFLATKPFRLGRSALETLAIIAYRQPITRAEIDQVRGIDSSHLMRTLIERGLVKMAGKAEVPGRPVQYATTPRFLEVVGLSTLADLPPLSELEQLKGSAPVPENPLEEGLSHFLVGAPGDQVTEEEDTAGLSAIEDLIQSAGKVDNEIYPSPLHAEVARENQGAHEALLAFLKPPRRNRKKAQEIAEAAVTESVDLVTETPPQLIEN